MWMQDLASRVTRGRAAMALGVIALGFVAISWPRWQGQAGMAAGYAARMTCACRYIEGRDMASCDSDLAGLSGMGLVRLLDDPADRRVTGSIPLLARREARFRDGFGCLPDAP